MIKRALAAVGLSCLASMAAGNTMAPLGPYPPDEPHRLEYVIRCTALAGATLVRRDEFAAYPDAHGLHFRYMRDRGQFDILVLMLTFSRKGLDWAEVARSEDNAEILVPVMRDISKRTQVYSKAYKSLLGQESASASSLISNDLAACGAIPAPD